MAKVTIVCVFWRTKWHHYGCCPLLAESSELQWYQIRYVWHLKLVAVLRDSSSSAPNKRRSLSRKTRFRSSSLRFFIPYLTSALVFTVTMKGVFEATENVRINGDWFKIYITDFCVASYFSPDPLNLGTTEWAGLLARRLRDRSGTSVRWILRPSPKWP